MEDYILIIDTGCSIIKTVIFDLNGKTIIEEKKSLPFTFVQPNQYTRNLDEVWDCITYLIKKAIYKSKISPKSIIAVSSVSYANGLILLDSYGKPTYDAISSIDSRADSIVEEFNKTKYSYNLREITLKSTWAGQSAMLLKWFKENNKTVLDMSAYCISSKDYSNFRLTGNITTDKTSISATNLFNIKNKDYDDNLLDILELTEYKHILPKVTDCSYICGHISKTISKATGLSEDTPVATGLMDLAGSSLASGLINTKLKENLLINIIAGTWTIDQYITSTPQLDPKIFSTQIHPSSNHWTVSNFGPTSTSNLDWYIKHFLKNEVTEAKIKGKSIFDLCDNALKITEPEDSEIIFLPFIHGSNISPKTKGNKRLQAGFCGIKSTDTQKNIIRSIYEGITFSHICQLNSLLTSFPQTALIRLAGGGSASREWAQIFADSIQTPVETTKCNNTHALGSAICAAVGIGAYPSLECAADKMVHIKERVEPNCSKKDIYEEKYFKYRSLISKLS